MKSPPWRLSGRSQPGAHCRPGPLPTERVRSLPGRRRRSLRAPRVCASAKGVPNPREEFLGVPESREESPCPDPRAKSFSSRSPRSFRSPRSHLAKRSGLQAQAPPEPLGFRESRGHSGGLTATETREAKEPLCPHWPMSPGFRLQLRSSNSKLQTSSFNFQLWSSNFKLQTPNFKFQLWSSKFKLQTSSFNFGVQTSNFNFGLRTPGLRFQPWASGWPEARTPVLGVPDPRGKSFGPEAPGVPRSKGVPGSRSPLESPLAQELRKSSGNPQGVPGSPGKSL